MALVAIAVAMVFEAARRRLMAGPTGAQAVAPRERPAQVAAVHVTTLAPRAHVEYHPATGAAFLAEYGVVAGVHGGCDAQQLDPMTQPGDKTRALSEPSWSDPRLRRG